MDLKVLLNEKNFLCLSINISMSYTSLAENRN